MIIERKLTSPLRMQIERIFNEKNEHSSVVESVDKDKPRDKKQQNHPDRDKHETRESEKEGKLDLIA